MVTRTHTYTHTYTHTHTYPHTHTHTHKRLPLLAIEALRRATSAATALTMRVFENDGVTPDALGIDVVGMYPHSVTGQFIVCIIPDRAL